MKFRQIVALCIIAFFSYAQAQPSVQQSHIEANAPDAGSFHVFLKRDLIAYLKASEPGFTDLVQVELLRDAPTQSGVSYPKYYAWVKYRVGTVRIDQGAVRLAAIDKVKFEVTNFVSASVARRDRGAVEKVFPSALVPDILLRASKS